MRSVLGSLTVGLFGGMLLMLVCFSALGVFKAEKLILIPVIQGAPPTATRTPAPTRTPTEEQLKDRLHNERWKFDNGNKVDPHNAPNSNPVIETAKRKKSSAVVEAAIFMLVKEDPRFGPVIFGTMIHRCCFCALTHDVEFKLTLSSLGLPFLYQRWETDEKRTHKNRVEQFGPRYWEPIAPFGYDMQDPFQFNSEERR